MAEFIQEAPATRQAQTHWDDTLQKIALRELGDASRWVELALLNGLKPPYIQTQSGPGILAYGDSIAIPAPVAVATGDAVFLRDVLLDKGRLKADAGRLKLAGGLDNFNQAIQIRINTVKRELAFRPDFGCWVSSLIGAANGPVAGQLAAFYVRSSLLQDDRVASVPSCSATVVGDSIRIEATVNPITGRAVDIQAIL